MVTVLTRKRNLIYKLLTRIVYYIECTHFLTITERKNKKKSTITIVNQKIKKQTIQGKNC